jgi:hypothetical protein
LIFLQLASLLELFFKKEVFFADLCLHIKMGWLRTMTSPFSWMWSAMQDIVLFRVLHPPKRGQLSSISSAS